MLISKLKKVNLFYALAGAVCTTAASLEAFSPSVAGSVPVVGAGAVTTSVGTFSISAGACLCSSLGAGSAHFGGLAHSDSCQGPISLSIHPPSHSHSPPYSFGRFSLGTCP